MNDLDLAIVDLETTGTSPAGARVTEFAMVRIRRGEFAEEWSTLINPGMSIPPAIQWLTGITERMVADAPGFSEVAEAIAAKLEGCVLVAHNARFDYGFLKAEFARAGMEYSAKTLCTVRLSRALYPEERQHGLDALIARHRLSSEQRHRALGDARIVWEFLQKLRRDFAPGTIEAAVNRLLKRPSLPSHLPPDALERVPEGPGVYVFYGLNRHPLYIGKSVTLRQRVGAHFSADHHSGRDLQLSRELVEIECEETAGELGALLRESELIKLLLPAHNIRLRRREEFTTLRIDAEGGKPKLVKALDVSLDEVGGCYGMFDTRRAARQALQELASANSLCAKLLGLEAGPGPCFARQLGHCRGACIGVEHRDEHAQRLKEVLEPLRVQSWPFAGTVALRERSASREDLHVVDRWCYLGTAATLASAYEISQRSVRRFDPDAYRILAGYLRKTCEPEFLSLD